MHSHTWSADNLKKTEHVIYLLLTAFTLLWYRLDSQNSLVYTKTENRCSDRRVGLLDEFEDEIFLYKVLKSLELSLKQEVNRSERWSFSLKVNVEIVKPVNRKFLSLHFTKDISKFVVLLEIIKKNLKKTEWRNWRLWIEIETFEIQKALLHEQKLLH